MEENGVDRYFFSIELDDNQNKIIHLFANIYHNGDNEFRITEWTFLYIGINQIKEMLADDIFYEFINERVNYLTDITEKEALQIAEKYFNGKSGINLQISNITEDIPCGDYWFE